MDFDFKADPSPWSEAAALAHSLAANGFSGMLYTEGAQVPWMMIAAAASAAPALRFCTGISVAFPRSPMMSAQIAWELARNTAGRFRLGLGSQVKAHITRRYAAEFDHPAARMKDYVLAVKACLRAFRREAPLQHAGRFYSLDLLPEQWTPAPHDFGEVPLDIAAVGPLMCEVAGEVADGVHVHPMHSLHYLENRLLPHLARGARRVERSVEALRLIVPVFAIPGDSPEERASLERRARMQIGFYGCTPNYAFQFDDLGFGEVTPRLRACLRKGDNEGLADLVSEEILQHFAVAARWDDLADRLIDRYHGRADRLVAYLAGQSIRERPDTLPKWGEIARAVRAA